MANVSSEVQKSKIDVNFKTLIHTAVMCALMFGFRYVPAPGAVTEYGMAVLGVFLALVYGWSFIGILWPSLLGMFGLAIAGYGTVDAVALGMLNNSTVFMMIVGTLAFMALMQSKAADYILGKMLSSNLAKKSPQYLVMIFLLTVVLVSSLGAVMVLYFGIFPIVVAMIKKCGYPRGDRFSVMFLTGYLTAVQLGVCFKPFAGWGLQTVGTMMQLTQTSVSFGAYMILIVILDIAFAITYPFFMKLCGCNFERLVNVDIVETFGVDKNQKLNLTQKVVLIALCVFLAIVIIGSVAGSALGVLYTYYSQIGVAGMMVAFWIAMTVIKVDGKPMLDIREAGKMFTWDMLFLVAIALLISSVLTGPDTGISSWLAAIVSPIFAGKSPVFFLIILGITTIVLTNVANNIAVCYIMLNLVASMYLNGFPVDILPATMIIAVFSVIAFLTPASSMPGAMLHASEMCTAKAIYKTMPLILVYFTVLALVIFILGGSIF